MITLVVLQLVSSSPLIEIFDCRSTQSTSADPCGPAVVGRDMWSQDWCATSLYVQRHEIGATNALRGKVLDVVINGYNPAIDVKPFTDPISGAVSLSGFTPTLINDIAELGGFQWRALLVKDPDVAYSFNYTSWLTDWVNRADLIAPFFYDTKERRDYGRLLSNDSNAVAAVGRLVELRRPSSGAVACPGIAYPFNMYNLDGMLLTLETEDAKSFTQEYLVFMSPFSWGVWGGLMGMFALFGVAMSFIEGNMPHTAPTNASGRSSWALGRLLDIKQFCRDFYYAAYSFVAPGGYVERADSHTGYGHHLAFAFEIMATVFLAMYTANLAAFFTAESTSSAQISSLQDVIARGSSVCYRNGSQIGNSLETGTVFEIRPDLFYPISTKSGDWFEVVDSAHKDAIAAMRAGKCLAYIVSKWEADEILATDTNSRCDLKLVYPEQTKSLGGWVRQMRNAPWKPRAAPPQAIAHEARCQW